MLTPTFVWSSGIYNPGSGGSGGGSGLTYSSFSAVSPITYNSATGAIGATPVSLSTQVVGILPVANGGTATASPGLVVGTNITSITGTWPNQTINATTQTDGSGFALTPATVTINAAQGLTVSSAITVSMPSGVVATTSTITSTMSVVLASAPASTFWITLTLPSAASNPGANITIYKVDTTTVAIKIVGSGSELIEGTGTIRLDAPFQHASLHSLGSAGWGSGIGGIQRTPSYLGPDDMTSGSNIGASSRTYVCPIDIAVPVIVTGYRFYLTAGAANITVGIFDPAGTLITSTGPVAVSSFGQNSITMATPFPVAPGQYFWGFAVSNNVIQIGADNVNGGNGSILCSVKNGTTGTLPNPYVFPGSSFTKKFGMKILVNGGRTTE